MPPTFDDLRNKLVEILKNRRAEQGAAVSLNDVWTDMKEYLRHAYNEPAVEQYSELVNDAWWDLMLRGIVAPYRKTNREPGFFHVTEFGKKAITENITIIYDPAGYLGQVVNLAPRLDDIAKSYLAEAIGAFNKDMLLSSTITLGTASERLILLLLEKFAASLSSPADATFKSKVDPLRIAKSFDHLKAVFSTKAGEDKIPSEYEEEFVSHIEPLFTLYRLHRNAAGHPTGRAVDKDTLRAHLQSFAQYCVKLYRLMDFLDGKLGTL